MNKKKKTKKIQTVFLPRPKRKPTLLTAKTATKTTTTTTIATTMTAMLMQATQSFLPLLPTVCFASARQCGTKCSAKSLPFSLRRNWRRTKSTTFWSCSTLSIASSKSAKRLAAAIQSICDARSNSNRKPTLKISTNDEWKISQSCWQTNNGNHVQVCCCVNFIHFSLFDCFCIFPFVFHFCLLYYSFSK